MENQISEKTNKSSISMVKIFPVFLALIIIIVDQVTKLFIFNNVPFGTIYASFFDGLLRITHVWNTGAAFSFGHDFAPFLRTMLLKVLPLIVLIVVIVYYFKTNELSRIQQWCIWGVVGGGFGNLIDRFFRPGGVVDFIDVDFFDIDFLGLYLTRWPVFNVADMAVVISGALLLVSFIIDAKHEIANSKKTEEEK